MRRTTKEDKMRNGTLTRKQAIKIVGEETVKKAENREPQPTHRIGYRGEDCGEEFTEWRTTSILIQGNNGVAVDVYYYIPNCDSRRLANFRGDKSMIEWNIDGYEIVLV